MIRAGLWKDKTNFVAVGGVAWSVAILCYSHCRLKIVKNIVAKQKYVIIAN